MRGPVLPVDPEGEEGTRDHRIGQIRDIGTTILSPAFGLQGQNSLAKSGRDVAFIRYAHQKEMEEIGAPSTIHMVRGDRFRLSEIEDMDCGELYDLEEDPGEFRASANSAIIAGPVRAEIAHVSCSPMRMGRA